MLKPCTHFKCERCAVCTDISERKVFKSILEKLYPETYICKHAMYKITNFNGGEFILPSLEYISECRKGYFITDIYTSMVIYLNKDNFEVLCSKTGECDVTEPYVAEYNIKQQK